MIFALKIQDFYRLITESNSYLRLEFSFHNAEEPLNTERDSNARNVLDFLLSRAFEEHPDKFVITTTGSYGAN